MRNYEISYSSIVLHLLETKLGKVNKQTNPRQPTLHMSVSKWDEPRDYTDWKYVQARARRINTIRHAIMRYLEVVC